jgi:cytochrome b561
MVTGYTRTQIVLHWLIFILIAAQFLFSDSISQAWRAVMRGEEATYSAMVAQHIAFGELILVLVIWRFVIKARRGAPPLPENEHPMLKLAAHGTHFALYGLMVLLPLSGAAAWFGGVKAAATGHEVLKTLLMILVIFHIIGGLYQHFVLKSDVLTRIRKPQ